MTEAQRAARLVSEAGRPRRTFSLYSGAGNRFLLFPGEGTEDWSRLAPALCGRGAFAGQAADGLLLIGRGEGETAARMTLWNADGGRAEACGNGLRCVGWWLYREGRSGASLIATDAGTREVEVLESVGDRARVRAAMGRAECFSLSAPLPEAGTGLVAVGVRIGNPHCVLRVSDERTVPVEALGRALQAHPDFPEGVNVGFLAEREGRWRLRVFERGVGETEACGTGACAAASVIGGAGERLEIEMPGGALEVRLSGGGRVELLGDARFHGEVELALPTEEPRTPR